MIFTLLSVKVGLGIFYEIVPISYTTVFTLCAVKFGNEMVVVMIHLMQCFFS